MKTLMTFLVAVFFIGIPMASATPVFITDAEGQLLGTNNVDVNGTIYNVEFLDGTCTEVYGTCDESGFPFTADSFRETGHLGDTVALAGDAARVLFDQVFVRRFSNPELTRGCEVSDECRVIIPTHIHSNGVGLGGKVVCVFCDLGGGPRGYVGSFLEGAVDLSKNVLTTIDLADRPSSTWSRWTRSDPIPEPGTILLFSTGLLFIAGYQWRQGGGNRI